MAETDMSVNDAIDSLGMRKGLTRTAWIPSARPRATTTIVTSSINDPRVLFSLLRATLSRTRLPPAPYDLSSSG